MMPDRKIQEHCFGVARLTVPVPSFGGFQARYEAAVPAIPTESIRRLVAQNAPWPEMLGLIEASAPHGFLIYFRNDVHPVMALAGDEAACVSYLMGNHTIAERMFRHDPRAMLYAPLHTVIWEDADRDAWFTVDQPSTQFASFDSPEIAQVGVDLDRKLASLLHALEIPVPESLLNDEAEGRNASYTGGTRCK
jgi:uncharacterized protein (DUF302 family)